MHCSLMVTKQRTSSPSLQPTPPIITALTTIAIMLWVILIADLIGLIHLANLFVASPEIPQKNIVQDTTKTPTSDLVTPSGRPVLLCDNNQVPVTDAAWETVCTTIEPLTSSCLGHDGNIYKPGETLTFYKIATLSGSKSSAPACQAVQKICQNGIFTGNDPTNEFVHHTCQVIDTTNADMLTCEYEGNRYLPWEIRIMYNQTQAAQWDTCRGALTLCTEQGKWYSNFSGSVASTCTFARTFERGFLENNISELIEDETWLPKQQALGFVTQAQWASCMTPRWKEVPHGTAVTSFEDEQVDFTQECVSKTSICVDGTWNNGITPFSYATCNIKAPRVCDVNGYILQHDSKHTFYKAGKIISGKYTCEEQTKYCFDGKVDGDETYKYASCSPQQKSTWPASCPSPYGAGAARKHGQQWTAYMQGKVSFSQSCEAVGVVCAYGQMRFGTLDSLGAAIWQKLSKTCTTNTPQDCTWEYGTVAHGASITAYRASSVSFGDECQAQIRTCMDGYLDGSYTAKSCVIGKAASCRTSCGTIAHGESVTTYDMATIPFGNGETCQTHSQVSTCENGNLSAATLSSCSCKIADPVGCTAPNGTFIPHMGSLTLYQYDKVYGQAQDGVDQCPRQVRQCINGQFFDYTGKPNPLTYKYSKCEIIPPSAPAQ